uniref:Uncharacterized protein n=1 Tax=Stegastes partitus TaxID=144197 RepID=A0A3B5BCQ7_9TELE
MSEEAVRQTRSQKRALEREAAPQSGEPSNADNESKKPKLDPSEPETEEQTKPQSDVAVAQDGESRTTPTPELEKEKEQEQEQKGERCGCGGGACLVFRGDVQLYLSVHLHFPPTHHLNPKNSPRTK